MLKIPGLDKLIRRWATEREGHTVIDPVTLSRGVVLLRLGLGKDKWDRPVELVLVRVLKKNEHHHKGDEIIWEIPPDAELQKVSPHGVHTRTDLLRLWVNSPGRGSSSND